MSDNNNQSSVVKARFQVLPKEEWPKEERSEPFVEVPRPGGSGSTNREPTKAEMLSAEGLKQVFLKNEADIAILSRRLEALRAEIDSCPHTVVYDIPSFMYDTRVCYSCGGHIGLI